MIIDGRPTYSQCCHDYCFFWQAMSEVRGKLSYIKQEMDRNRKYKVQLRASRHDDCRTTTTRPAYWSDWTEPIGEN